MKKIGASLLLFLLLFSVALVFADNETNDTVMPSASVDPQQDLSKGLDDGFNCLEEKAGDCSKLSNQEIALTILATPDNIFDNCVSELKNRKSSNNWGNIKDTALAILALKHAGEDTKSSEEWLLNQEKTPTDLIWYLQQDSNEESECHIGYQAKDYTVNINANKKIDSDAGSCLTRAQSNFWLKVSPNCFDEDFLIECNKNFITTLLYKNKKSSIIYVLEGTKSAEAFGSTTLNVKSKCFGQNSCDYESTIWATVALLETGHNIKDFIPYIIAMSDSNEKYLPGAFVYMLTNYEDYATQLIANQKLGNYWEAKSTANNRYYDTALALISLGSSSSEQITRAKDWLIFSQGTSNGCWNNNIKDTAIVLWALAGRSGKSSGGGGVTYCSEANYFCIPSNECPDNEDVGSNYFCASLSDTCCTNENLKKCSDYGGKQCNVDQTCSGNSRRASDALDGDCCTGTCQEKSKESECEANFYTCMNSCSDFQEPIPDYSCNGADICCRTKTSDSKSESTWWIWLLIIFILIVLGVLGYVYRNKLKLYWFQIKTRFKKDKSSGKGAATFGGPGPRRPPRPGFPPVRRYHAPVASMGKKSYDRRDTAMAETFKKLREMSR